jgi:hypothetical protein
MQILLGESPDADIFRRAIKFFSKSLFTPGEKRGLKIRVLFKDEERCGEARKVKENAFDITIPMREKIDGALFVLAHETVHVRQLLRKELTFRGGLPHWKGENVSKIPYLELPYEVEATALGKVLTHKFIFCC